MKRERIDTAQEVNISIRYVIQHVRRVLNLMEDGQYFKDVPLSYGTIEREASQKIYARFDCSITQWNVLLADVIEC